MSSIEVDISRDAKRRLDLFIKKCDKEISGFGEVEHNPETGRFLITQIHLLEQECSGASTDIDAKTISKMLTEAVRRDLPVEKLKLWWHSHVNMSAFWSGTDENTATSFNNGWMLSYVGNKRGEYKMRLDVYYPTRLVAHDVKLVTVIPKEEKSPLQTAIEAEETIIEEARKQFEAQIAERKKLVTSLKKQISDEEKDLISNLETIIAAEIAEKVKTPVRVSTGPFKFSAWKPDSPKCSNCEGQYPGPIMPHIGKTCMCSSVTKDYCSACMICHPEGMKECKKQPPLTNSAQQGVLSDDEKILCVYCGLPAEKCRCSSVSEFALTACDIFYCFGCQVCHYIGEECEDDTRPEHSKTANRWHIAANNKLTRKQKRALRRLN